MNLRTLHYFLVAAEEENVTKAAERLFISQQALSVHIKRLEDEYGVTLFERKPFFRLTDAGRRMVYYSRQLLGIEDEMQAEFSDLDIHAKGTLRVGMSRLRSNAFFPSIWEKYYETHPNISIDLMDGNRQQLSDYMASGKLDIFIALDVQADPALAVHPLYEERILCIFRLELLQKYYPDTWESLLDSMHREGVSLPRISQFPFIGTRTDNILRTNTDQLLPRQTSLSYILETNLQQTICKLAIQGYGAGIVSPAALYYYTTVTGEPEDPDLCVFPLDKSMGSYICSLAYRRDWHIPSYARDFIDDVKSSFSEYQEFMQKRFSI